MAEVYYEPWQAFKLELFVKTVNTFYISECSSALEENLLRKINKQLCNTTKVEKYNESL